MLVAPLVGLALDVQHDPAGLRIAIAGAVPLHRGRVGLGRLRAWLRPRRTGDDEAAITSQAAESFRIEFIMRAPIPIGGAADQVLILAGETIRRGQASN